MQTAIGYIRVSDQRQVHDGNSLATQEKQVRQFAQLRGYQMDRLFVEPGESAKTDDRPALQEMLRYCITQKGRIATLIIPKIDRLARNTYDYTGLKLRLQRVGVRLESVGERIEDTPVGRFTESILASVAQFDNEVRAERCRNGMIQAVSEGRWVWKAPLGYRNVRFNGRATIEPDPVTGSLISELFRRLATGSRPLDALAWMESKGVSMSRSGYFSLIRNKLYIGVIDVFDEPCRSAPPFVPLASESEFYAAQASITSKQFPRSYERDNAHFPLRGTLLCECGKLMTASWSKGRSRSYAHYRCKNCPRINLRREAVHARFARHIKDHAPDVASLEQLGKILQEEAADIEADVRQSVSLIDKDLASTRLLQESIATKNAMGVIPDRVAKEKLEELELRIVTLEQKKSNYSRESSNTRDLIEFGRSFLQCIDERWREASLAAKKALQHYTFPDGLVITRNLDFRTAKSGSPSGLEALSLAIQSAVVDPDSQTPKNSRSRPVNLKRQRRQCLSTIVASFKECRRISCERSGEDEK